MIILLNGISSAGKSSIAPAIQDISDKMWMHLGIDTFIDRVHKIEYDFIMDTAKMDSISCAKKILEFVEKYKDQN